MKTVNEITGFGQRLLYLYGQIDIPADSISAAKLAEYYFKRNLFTYASADSQTQWHERDQIGRTLKNHLKLATTEKVKPQYIQIYMDFFHCRPDFLYGYTVPAYDNITGLTPKSVAQVESIKASDPDALQALNQILQSPLARDLLIQLHYILNLPQYDITVFDSNGKKINLSDNPLNEVTNLSDKESYSYFTITDRNGNPVTRHRLTRQTLADDSMHRIQDLLFRISTQSAQDAPETL